MTKIVIMLAVMVNLLLGTTLNDVQMNNLKNKKVLLEKKVAEMDLPKQTVNIMLGVYLRESAVGIKTVEELNGKRKHIAKVSMGDYHMTFPAIVHVIKTYNLKQYYHFLDVDKKKVKREKELELAKLSRYNKVFNTEMALYYFKCNYEEAIKRNFKDPLYKAVSKHNGFWNNYKYVNLVKKDIATIKVALASTKNNNIGVPPRFNKPAFVNTLELWKNI